MGSHRIWSTAAALTAAGCLALLGAGAAGAAPKNKAPVASTVPWSGTDLAQRHPVLAGETTTLKGTASDQDGTVVEYEWAFGDGESTGRLPVTDPFLISADHTYAGDVGQDITATLTVWDDKGASASADYLMTVMADTIEVRNNVAIDKALWWMHKQMVRYDYGGDAAKPCGRIQNDEWNPGMVTDAFALQGFEEQGHLPGNNPNNDPYVDDARRLLNELSSWVFVVPAQAKPNGMPDSPDPVTGAPDGLMMGTMEDHYEYEPGVILKAFVNSGMGESRPVVANDALNLTGNPANSVTNFTYNQIAQNFIDYIAWAQLYDQPNDYSGVSYDWSTCEVEGFSGRCLRHPVQSFTGPAKDTETLLNPKSRGSWPYWAEGWSDPMYGARGGWGDIAMAFWIALGLQEAESKVRADGVTPLFSVPSFVKTELAQFVSEGNNIQNLGNTADPNYGSVYFGPNDDQNFHNSYHLVERAAELLVVLDYLGLDQTDPRAAAALGFIDSHWNSHNYDIGQTHPVATAWINDPVQGWIRVPAAVSDSYKPYFVDLDWYVNGSYSTPGSWISNDSEGNNYSFFHLYATDGESLLWGFEEGRFDGTGVWVQTKTGDDLNIFAFYAVSRALDGLGIADFPSTDPEGLTWEGRITKLLANNQLPDGSFNEYNWVYGSPFGTPWALMTMMEREPVASTNTMTVGSINFANPPPHNNGTEHLVTTVKIADAVGAGVSGATVVGTLDLAGSPLQSGWAAITGATGEAAFDYSVNKQALAPGTYTFTVTSVTAGGLTLVTPLPTSASFVK